MDWLWWVCVFTEKNRGLLESQISTDTAFTTRWRPVSSWRPKSTTRSFTTSKSHLSNARRKSQEGFWCLLGWWKKTHGSWSQPTWTKEEASKYSQAWLMLFIFWTLGRKTRCGWPRNTWNVLYFTMDANSTFECGCSWPLHMRSISTSTPTSEPPQTTTRSTTQTTTSTWPTTASRNTET